MLLAITLDWMTHILCEDSKWIVASAFARGVGSMRRHCWTVPQRAQEGIEHTTLSVPFLEPLPLTSSQSGCLPRAGIAALKLARNQLLCCQERTCIVN